MSITARPFGKRELRQLFYSDPALSAAERFVAIELMRCMTPRLQPVERLLDSQAALGGRTHHRRETVNRALRKLRSLGYFRTTWKTVQRMTAQGWKGVTRVQIELGPVVQHLISTGQRVSPGHAHCVIQRHPSYYLPARGVAVSDDVVANSADRRARRPVDTREHRRSALAQWPRLAGGRPVRADQLPSSVPPSHPSIGGIAPAAAYRAWIAEQDAALARKVKAPRRDL